MKKLGEECIWCGGGELVCALCGETIPCMFCNGTNTFHPEQQLTAHVCAFLLAQMPGKGTA